MAKYKKCPGCGIDLKPAAPVCYVCGLAQPGFEGATQDDLERFDAALADKAEREEDKPKGLLIAIILGWLVVFLILVGIFLVNQSLLGPGGPG